MSLGVNHLGIYPCPLRLATPGFSFSYHCVQCFIIIWLLISLVNCGFLQKLQICLISFSISSFLLRPRYIARVKEYCGEVMKVRILKQQKYGAYLAMKTHCSLKTKKIRESNTLPRHLYGPSFDYQPLQRSVAVGIHSPLTPVFCSHSHNRDLSVPLATGPLYRLLSV